jgi:UDP-glucose 4-epimerase
VAGLRGRRVLITGGLGFIGSNLAVAAARSGAVVTIYDSLDPACGGNLANVEQIEDEIEIVRDDIRSRERIATVLDETELVINCAAYTSHLRSMEDPAGYLDVNCAGVLNLLEASRAARLKPRFIQIGTSTQVGRASSEPITEEHAEHPLDVYSATKTAAEKLALAYGAAHGLPVSVVRLSNVYGPRARLTDPGLGFVSYFVGLALQDREIDIFGDGSQRRTITYVDDVVGAIVRVAASDRCIGQVFFAASADRYSVRQIGEAVIKAVGRGRLRNVPWPAERAAIEVGDNVISSEKIARYTGWRASVGLEEGMRLTASYFAGRLPLYLP